MYKEYGRSTIASAAPNAAPCDKPKIYGETRGFLSVDCKEAPDTERAAPVKPHKIMRGSLMYRRIRRAVLSRSNSLVRGYLPIKIEIIMAGMGEKRIRWYCIALRISFTPDTLFGDVKIEFLDYFREEIIDVIQNFVYIVPFCLNV